MTTAWQRTDTERRVEVPWMLQRLGTPAHLLDVGSADAPYLGELVEAAGELHLLDMRPVPHAPQGAIVHQLSIADLPVELHGCFDVITCISTLDHVGLADYGLQPNEMALERAVVQLYVALKPNGRLLLTVPAGRDQFAINNSTRGQIRIFSLAALGELFSAAKWQQIDVSFWRLASGDYIPAEWEEIADYGFAGHRAAGAIGMELRKL